MSKQVKRVALTKESIEVAYLDLLESHQGERISVKEVCEKAGVNRTTFYKYYQDSAYLGNMVRQHILEYLEQLLQETIPDNHSDTYEFLSRVILNIYRDPRVRKLPLLYHEDEFRMQVEQLIRKYYFNPKFGSRLSEDDWVRATYCQCGFIGLMESWINDGMSISPEKIANTVIQMSKNIRGMK